MLHTKALKGLLGSNHPMQLLSPVIGLEMLLKKIEISVKVSVIIIYTYGGHSRINDNGCISRKV